MGTLIDINVKRAYTNHGLSGTARGLKLIGSVKEAVGHADAELVFACGPIEPRASVYRQVNGSLALSIRILVDDALLDGIIDSVFRILGAKGRVTAILKVSGENIGLDIDGDLWLHAEGKLTVTEYDLHYEVGSE